MKDFNRPRERFIFFFKHDGLVEGSLSQRGDALLEQVLAASADHPLAPQVRGFAVGEGSEVGIHEMMTISHQIRPNRRLRNCTCRDSVRVGNGVSAA